MPFSPADSQLFAPLFSDPIVAGIFSDEQFVRSMLAVEAALAMVQGRLGVIPATAVAPILTAANSLTVDWLQMQAGIEKAGMPVIELVRQLRQQVGGDAAAYVHWGATSQDIVDTALILQIQAALDHLAPLLDGCISSLARLADKHRHTLMAGRTHSQHALPITFGLKVANWLAPLLRHRQRLSQLRPRLLVLQFGGAAGTLAALGQQGEAVQAALATALGLGLPPLPWHTQRDNLVEFAGWLSLVSGSLAKMAQDIILLAQTEVGELQESADEQRGGSSTMPQKNNPVISELVIAAARTNAALLAAMHQAQIQEHERATHGWQMEWLTLPQMVGLTAVALQKSLFLSQHMVVHEARMRQNIQASQGLMLAEAITFALAEQMDPAVAKALVQAACQTAVAQGRHLLAVVREATARRELADTAVALDWATLADEAAYLGSTQLFIDRVLQEAGWRKEQETESPRKIMN